MEMRTIRIVTTSLAMSVCLGACSSGPSKTTTTTATPIPFTATAPGYTLSVFAKAPASNLKPDSITLMNNSVYIGYQKAGDVKDGSDPSLTNPVVQYDLKGKLLKTYTVPGHVDGLMPRTDTNQLWCMSNEDGNPLLTIIDLTAGTQRTLSATVNPTAHGGGFDDMQFLNGVVYASASNPTTPGAPPPTIVSISFNSNGTTFDVSPVLVGNATATDITPSIGGSPNPNYNVSVPLVLSDPDSMTIDASGTRLVLDSQADAKLVFVANPGPAQTVSVLTLTLYNDKDGPNMPVDDTRWVPAPGPSGTSFMLFTDANNTTYRVDAGFNQGDSYSCGQGMVMQLDPVSGHLTPIVVGIGAGTLQDPHGMLFVPF